MNSKETLIPQVRLCWPQNIITLRYSEIVFPLSCLYSYKMKAKSGKAKQYIMSPEIPDLKQEQKTRRVEVLWHNDSPSLLNLATVGKNVITHFKIWKKPLHKSLNPFSTEAKANGLKYARLFTMINVGTMKELLFMGTNFRG